MTFNLEVDMYADIYPEGIKRSLFIGDSCEPCFEEMEPWQDIIDRNVGYHVRPSYLYAKSTPIGGTICAEDLEELNKTLEGFENAAKMLKKKIKEYEKNNK